MSESHKIQREGSRHTVKLKNAIREMTDRFQNGRRRYVGTSSERYKMGNYHPISIKFYIQTQKSMLS
jgi:hypothetical protein